MSKIFTTNDSNCNGTSFHNTIVITTKSKLVELFGEPKNCSGGDDKVVNVWVISVDGDVCTIYDWKEYRVFGDDELIEWHIGGYKKSTEMKLKEYIEKKL